MNPTMYVLGFAFNKTKDKVLLIKKEKKEGKKENWQAGFFNGLGGKIEAFENFPIEAMVREFKEECNISTLETDWKQYATIQNSFFHVTCFFSVLDNIENFEILTNEKVYSVEISSLFKEQFKNCLSNLIWLIPMALESIEQPLQSDTTYQNW